MGEKRCFVLITFSIVPLLSPFTFLARRKNSFDKNEKTNKTVVHAQGYYTTAPMSEVEIAINLLNQKRLGKCFI